MDIQIVCREPPLIEDFAVFMIKYRGLGRKQVSPKTKMGNVMTNKSCHSYNARR